MLEACEVVPGPQLPGFGFLWPLPYLVVAVAVVLVPSILLRRGGQEAPKAEFPWGTIVPVAGLAVLAASNLVLYVRQLSWRASCPPMNVPLGCPEVDASLLVWGLIWGALVIVLIGAYEVGLRRIAPRPLVSAGGLGLVIGVVSSFVIVIAALSLTSSGAASMDQATIVGRGFVSVGFLVLFLIGCGVFTFTGGWATAGRIAALAHGAVSMTVALIAIVAALGPPPALL